MQTEQETKLNNEIVKILEVLEKDQDFDVQYYAQLALKAYLNPI